MKQIVDKLEKPMQFSLENAKVMPEKLVNNVTIENLEI